jgi:hypothetical protein
MTAITLTQAQISSLMVALDAAYEAKGLAAYWRPMPVPILTGPHAGKLAMDLGPEALSMQMRGGLSLEELPEFASILTALGNPVPVTVAQTDLKNEVYKI